MARHIAFRREGRRPWHHPPPLSQKEEQGDHGHSPSLFSSEEGKEETRRNIKRGEAMAASPP